MHETDLHDLSDDADYAASVQQGSTLLSRSDSSRRNSLSEPEGAEIVYSKDNVAIHPTQYASERISGRLKLIKEGNSLFMTWIPYKGRNTNARLSEKDKNLYTIKAVPFSDIRSIRRHTPTLGWQYIIVVMSSGLAFPPLYFYNGGVREFLAIVKRQVILVRSAEDANVFLLNDFQNPLQRSLSSLKLPRVVSIANVPSSTDSPNDFPLTSDHGKDVNESTGSRLQPNGRERRKDHDPAKDLSIQVLEKFSLVTRFARETTSSLFRDNSIDGSIQNERRYHEPPDHNLISFSNDFDKLPDKVPVAPDPLEFDKVSLVWGKPRQSPLEKKEWVSFLDSEGRIIDSEALRKRIFYGGVEHDIRKEVWKFLLGFYSYDSTYAEREYLVTVKSSEYKTIKKQWQSISVDQSRRFTKFRERKSLIDKDVVRTDRAHSFYDGDDNSNVYLLRDILLTYSFYNFDLGYCQGMSDLLSPIVFVIRDESESFWCFASLMERLGPNFNRDQSGMHSQLFALSKLVEILDSPLHNYFKQNDCLNYFFCFRWILIQFKREFDYEKTMRLWEVLWTHHLSEHLHLYVCVAILKRYRSKIMGEQMDFDTLLKFINELSEHIDLDRTLRDAEALCICAGENGAACIPPGTPPSLPIQDVSIYPQHDEDDILSQPHNVRKSFCMSGVVVLDNGGGLIKAGFGGERDPICVFPNCSARPQSSKKWLLADQLLSPSEDLTSATIRRPFDRGHLINPDLQSSIWAHLFNTLLKIHPPNVSLLLTQPLFTLPSIQRSVDEIIFEEFNFKSLFVSDSPSLVHLYEASRMPHGLISKAQCSLVVDCGFSFTHAAPVFQNFTLNYGVKRMDLGGKALTNYLKELVSYRSVNVMDESFIMDDVKEKLCFVSLDVEKDLKIGREPGNNLFKCTYVLPDGITNMKGFVKDPDEAKRCLDLENLSKVGKKDHTDFEDGNDRRQDRKAVDLTKNEFSMTNERFLVPEMIFRPADLGMKQAGLAECIVRAVNSCHPHLHPVLYESIILTGGSTLFPRFTQRLERDLRPLVPDKYQVKITTQEDPILGVWRGGSLLASNPHFEAMCVTKAEYEELGSIRCHKRFFN